MFPSVAPHKSAARRSMAAAAVVEVAQQPGRLSLPSPRGCNSNAWHVAPRNRGVQEEDISLVLAVQDARCRGGAGAVSEGAQYKHIRALPVDTIKQLKLRLHSKGWFAFNRHCLIFGERELVDHTTVEELLHASGRTDAQGFLHIFVRLSDIDSAEITTRGKDSGLGPLAHGMSPPTTITGARATTGAVHRADREEEEQGKAVATPLQTLSEVDRSATIVHLLVRRSAKVQWAHLQEGKFELSISCSDDVDGLKRRISAALELDAPWEGADGLDVVFGGQVLSSGRPLRDYGVVRDSVLELVPVEPLNSTAFPDGSPLLSSPAHELYHDWRAAREGLEGGRVPQLARAGTGGSYFLQDASGRNVAVFKPEDEEPRAVNNPKGQTAAVNGEGWKKGTHPGEGAVREVAAYLLDHDHFAGVPPTALVSCLMRQHRKVGSLQSFVSADSDCEEWGPGVFPVPEVHKICVLDIRLANTDRNGSNILAKQTHPKGWVLTPIDHGYCLPDCLEDISFEWIYWPQAKVPFSAQALRYIQDLDVRKDVSILEAHGIHLTPNSRRVFAVCTMLLKKAASKGMTAYNIGSILTRQDARKSSIERLHSHAQHQCKLSVQRIARGGKLLAGQSQQSEEETYLTCMDKLLDEFLDDYVLEDASLLYGDDE